MNRKIFFPLLLLFVFVFSLCLSLSWSQEARLFPLIITIAGILTAVMVVASEVLVHKTQKKHPNIEKIETEKPIIISFDKSFFSSGEFTIILWISGLIGLILLFGFSIAVLIFTTFFMLFFGRENVKTTTALTGGIWLVIYLIFHVSLKIPLYNGIIALTW